MIIIKECPIGATDSDINLFNQRFNWAAHGIDYKEAMENLLIAINADAVDTENNNLQIFIE